MLCSREDIDAIFEYHHELKEKIRKYEEGFEQIAKAKCKQPQAIKIQQIAIGLLGGKDAKLS